MIDQSEYMNIIDKSYYVMNMVIKKFVIYKN